MEPEAAGASEGEAPSLSRLDGAGVEAAVLGRDRVLHLAIVGPYDGRPRPDLEAAWTEDEVLHGGGDRVPAAGGSGRGRPGLLGCLWCGRPWPGPWDATSEIPAQGQGNRELESVAGFVSSP